MILAAVVGALIFGFGILIGAAIVQTTINKVRQEDV